MWETLVADLKQEQDLLLGRLTADELRQLHAQGLGWIEERDGKIVACTFLFATPAKEWYELGSVWVAPYLRGSGLGAAVFRECARRIKEKGLKTFLMTKNTKVAHLATAVGFSESTMETWGAVPWSASCALCDRVAEEGKPTCQFRATAECRLFFMN